MDRRGLQYIAACAMLCTLVGGCKVQPGAMDESSLKSDLASRSMPAPAVISAPESFSCGQCDVEHEKLVASAALDRVASQEALNQAAALRAKEQLAAKAYLNAAAERGDGPVPAGLEAYDRFNARVGEFLMPGKGELLCTWPSELRSELDNLLASIQPRALNITDERRRIESLMHHSNWSGRPAAFLLRDCGEAIATESLAEVIGSHILATCNTVAQLEIDGLHVRPTVQGRSAPVSEETFSAVIDAKCGPLMQFQLSGPVRDHITSVKSFYGWFFSAMATRQVEARKVMHEQIGIAALEYEAQATQLAFAAEASERKARAMQPELARFNVAKEKRLAAERGRELAKSRKAEQKLHACMQSVADADLNRELSVVEYRLACVMKEVDDDMRASQGIR